MNPKKGKANKVEVKNARLYPSNIIKNFPSILEIQKNSKFIKILKNLFFKSPTIIQSLQLYFNVHDAGWHIDSQSQLRHREYNPSLSINNYKLAKVGVYLSNSTKGSTLPSINLIKGSHKLPLFMHKLIHTLLIKFKNFRRFLDYISIDVGKYISQGDAVIFSHHLWHRSSIINKKNPKNINDKCVFYFEVGELNTAESFLKHNFVRSIFFEDFQSSGENYWCDYMRPGFSKDIKNHLDELSMLGISTPYLNSQLALDYLEKLNMIIKKNQ
tara:strand:+ start:3 stop:815 length:813 start_codon:yes stop_codon:yes gene_type:complete